MSDVRIYCGDALGLLAWQSNASIDAVIVDPPYEVTQNDWDALIPIVPMWTALRCVVKPGGAMVFTARNPFAAALIVSNQKQFKHEWIWHKNKASGHLNAKKAPMLAHESILVFCDGTPHYDPQMSDGHRPMNAYYTAHNGDNYGAGRQMAGGGSTQRYPRSVIDFAVVNNDSPERVHPTQKPLALMEYLVKTYTRRGDVVLDFATGSGTTGVACTKHGRNFIGIEKDRAIFDLAQKRIDRARNPFL